MRQPYSALVYAVTFAPNKGSRFLLLKRSPRPDIGLSDFWQGVSGGVEDNETPQEAAARELYEETGIKTGVFLQIDYSHSISMKPEWGHKFPSGTTEIIEYTFIAIVKSEIKPDLSGEHTEYRWCSLKDALELLLYTNNKEALIAANNNIQAMLAQQGAQPDAFGSGYL